MIGYFKTIGAKASNIDAAGLQDIIRSEHVANVCSEIAKGNKDAKRRLPAFTWQATFEEGATRSNKHARPTGLFMLDIDHIKEDANETFLHMLESNLALFEARLVVAHITPSQHGLRLVFICDGTDSTIAEQQAKMAEKLGIEIDTSTKDFARLSFAVPFSYFLYIDDQKLLKDYSNLIKNPDYETDNSKNSPVGTDTSAAVDNQEKQARADAAGISAESAGCDKEKDGDSSQHEPATFKGIAYKDIVSQLVAQTGGEPVEGERNVRLYNLCRKLRYICDFNSDKLFSIVPRFGLSEQEVKQVCESANKGGRTGKIPYDLWKIIDSLGGMAAEDEEQDGEEKENQDNNLPPLPPIFKQFVKIAPADFQPAVICSLLPVLGTLCSRLRAEYIDGETHAPNFQTVIEAPQASGKSFTRKIVNECLRPVIIHDNQERVKEQIYLEQCRQNKNAKKQPEEPQTLIRIIPASVSIAKLLKRLSQSQGLHLFSYLEELDTLTKSNKAGAWSQKSDIYRNAYDNALYGQDYMSESSFSALVNVYYNLLLCGTPKAVSRFYSDPEDGLVSRVLFSQLPSQFGAEMPKFKKLGNFERKMIEDRCNQLNQTLCVTTDDKIAEEHEMEMGWLNKKLEKWLEAERIKAIKENNNSRDIFRRRAAVNGFRAGMIAFYLYGEKLTKENRSAVEEFSIWIADYSLQNLLEKFSVSLNEQVEIEQKPNIRAKSIYDSLEDKFTKEDLYTLLSKRRVKTRLKEILYNWRKAGLIEQTDNLFTKKQ